MANANETIAFLSSLTGQNPQSIARNLGRVTGPGGGGGPGAGGAAGVPVGGSSSGGQYGLNTSAQEGSYPGSNGASRRTPTRADGQNIGGLQRQDSAVTQKADGEPGMPNREEIDRINANRVGTAGTVVT